MWPREDWVDTFSYWLFRGGHVVMRRGRNAKGSEQQTSDIIDLSISVLLNCKSNYRQTWYLFSYPAVLQIYVFYSHCLSNSTCLVESSNQWNYIFNTISSAISTWMLKEMSRIRGSNAIISGNTLRPALAASFFFAWSEGHPLSHKVSLVHDELSSKIDRLGSK